MDIKVSKYAGKTILLVTMHEKERYLNRASEKILGASLITTKGVIDTDVLGTFSGEIERRGSQEEVVLEKCLLGINKIGCSFGLASEGSFGPHPYIPFVYASFETLLFVDQLRGLKISERLLTAHTNYGHRICSSKEDLYSFLQAVRFPSHALIVRPHIWMEKTIIFKGIQDYHDLRKKIDQCCQRSPDGLAHVETDMRAHMNPTRGHYIQRLGIRLFRRLTRLCPQCHAPGWGRTDVKRGRPCMDCGHPSDLPMGYLWSCMQCGLREERPISPHLQYANAAYCCFCNP